MGLLMFLLFLSQLRDTHFHKCMKIQISGIQLSKINVQRRYAAIL